MDGVFLLRLFVPSSGDAGVGKATLLQRFERCVIHDVPSISSASILSYSYARGVDDDDEHAGVNIWTCHDPAQLAATWPVLLAALAASTANAGSTSSIASTNTTDPISLDALGRIGYIVCCDLSIPSSAATSAAAWLGLLHGLHSTALASRPAEEQQRCRNRIAQHIQFFVAPSAHPVNALAAPIDKVRLDALRPLALCTCG